MTPIRDDEELRADGRENRARVLAAARDVYREVGPAITTGAVAGRAGVSRATLYRTYPTRDAMLAEIVAEHLREWIALVEDALANTPADEPVFETAMRHAYEGNVGTWEALTDVTVRIKAVRALKLRGNALFIELVKAAIARGEIAADTEPEELSVLFRALRGAIPESQQGDPAVWKRYTQIVLRGLRPQD